MEQAHVPAPRALVVPFECITSNTVSVAVPVNVPEMSAVRLTVMNVLPSAVRTFVVVAVTTAKVPAEGVGGVAEAGVTARAAAAVTTRKRSFRISVLLSRERCLPSLLRRLFKVKSR